MNYSRTFWAIIILCVFSLAVLAQTETLTNNDVISMNSAGLSDALIARKIKNSNVRFETTTNDLIALKKAGLSDHLIGLMFDKKLGKQGTGNQTSNLPFSDSTAPPPKTFGNFYKTPPQPKPRIVLTKREALKNAKTIAIRKSSLQPSRQALEKELLKRNNGKTSI